MDTTARAWSPTPASGKKPSPFCSSSTGKWRRERTLCEYPRRRHLRLHRLTTAEQMGQTSARSDLKDVALRIDAFTGFGRILPGSLQHGDAHGLQPRALGR